MGRKIPLYNYCLVTAGVAVVSSPNLQMMIDHSRGGRRGLVWMRMGWEGAFQDHVLLPVKTEKIVRRKQPARFGE